jgi:uncharacterized oxidoreductase
MQMSGNTIFITGGTSGIGRGLAEAFQRRGNQVIISGRREDRLKELADAYPGMRYFVLDVTDPESIRDTARQAIAEFPSLNCVFNNAGIQMRTDFALGGPAADEDLVREIDTNLLGPIRVTKAFLPHLRLRPGATLVNVSSGLAFVPMARFPVYCATKAAVHAWTLSLRHQLRDTGVKVIELIPPYVATDLGGPGKPESATRAMPLDAFIAEAMKELESGAEEAAVADAKRLVAAACPDSVRKVFSAMKFVSDQPARLFFNRPLRRRGFDHP